MKNISNNVWVLYYNLGYYWRNMKPSYLNLWINDLFEIEIDIFREIEDIIGLKNF